MKNLPKAGVNPTNKATVLSISPIRGDHIALKEIFNRAQSEWALEPMPSLESARSLLRENRVPVVLSERDLGPDTWKEVLAELVTLPNPPLLIVSSRNADEYLWAEALNLGAYDVLAKPFDTGEVVRVVGSAWQRWKNGPDWQRNRRPTGEIAAVV